MDQRREDGDGNEDEDGDDTGVDDEDDSAWVECVLWLLLADG
jgi:hypothetical protein